MQRKAGLMIGKTLNHFKILDRLGKGGMGEVYVAEDAKLKRRVALKVLPEEVARDPARLDRFQREAEAIAALNHPNIVTIYSIEEAEGIPFLTMELVQGETLIQLIPSNGLDVESFLRLSSPVAEALSAAHEKGIIHRDLKPGNIMVSEEGRIKVLDFGLAKLMRDDSDPDSSRMETHAQTEDGIVLGTMPYMSPEQIQGKRLDHRSDIFSLGIIFYEMLTGRRPFQGSTSAELISSIMRDTPGPVGDLKAGTPEHLERILRRCLMKDPRDRYQTARDVYNELRDLNASSGSSKRPAFTSGSGEMWIAVLPFQHPAADPEMENFAEGLAQDITAALSQFSYLSVISQSTASTQSGARYLLKGGIRKSGSLIRVNVQLMDAHTGTNLWAETYNRDLNRSDFFTIQDEITDRVAATLGDNFGVLVRSMIVSLEDKPEDQLSANEFVFRFFGYWAKLTPEEHAKIRTSLEKAVQTFARNAEVWACLSIVYANEYYLRLNELPNSLDRCLRAAQRAVELNRTSQIAHEALAWAHFLRRDLAAMPAAIDRAISLNPRNSNTLATLGGLLVHTREFERGAELTHRAMELNPHHAGWFYFPLIWDHCSRGEWEQMLERAKRINMPGVWWVPLVIASACGHLGRKSEAAAAVNELLTIDPQFATHARDSMEPLLGASGLIDSLIEGLHRAGLQISEESSEGKSVPSSESRDFKASSGSTRAASSEMWIAVLPFQHPAADPEIETFADGLAEDITAALSQFSYLSVISQNSATRLKGQSYDVRTASAQLGARYVVQGGIRKSGSLIRVNVQLIDAQTGTNLWAETYNRDLKNSDIFTIQDEITDRVAATLGDNFGVLVRSMVASLEEKPDEQLSANEFVFRFFGYWAKLTPEEHAKIRTTLEKAVQKFPRNADLWACLSLVYANEYYLRLNELPNSLDRCLKAAQRAVELNRTSQIAYEALAWAHFLRRDLAAMPAAIDRALALNPRNSNTLAALGGLLVHTREFERGTRLVRRAMELNPHHAGWFHFPLIWDHCSRGEWEQMLEQAKRVNMPGVWGVPMVIASACGHLGRKSEAAAALNDLLALDPEAASHARDYMEPLHGPSGLIDSLIEGLQKAGLQIPDKESEGKSVTSSEFRDFNPSSGSSTRPASSEMWIAVLPFQHPAADPELENFADGLTQDITAALSQFSYLSVIRQDSTQRGARYVIQGGIRKSGTLIRVNVQLIDGGTNLWAETFNRDLKNSDIFTIQDEITDRVAATLADNSGVLVRSMVASLEDKPDDQLSANEFVFRFFGYWTKLTPEEHGKIRTTLERAIERIPRNADIRACLSLVYYHEFAFGFNELPNSLDRCLMAAQRAVELNRASQLAYEALTWAQFFRRDVGPLPATVERAISLNPRNSHMLAVAGLVLVHTRNFDRGAAVARRAMELNPHHAGWFHFSLIWDHYSRAEYEQALEQAKRVNMPGFFWPPLVIASVCGELGRKAEAASAVNELLAIDPEFAVHARRYIEPWHYASGLMDSLLEGLRKAGLEVS